MTSGDTEVKVSASCVCFHQMALTVRVRPTAIVCTTWSQEHRSWQDEMVLTQNKQAETYPVSRSIRASRPSPTYLPPVLLSPSEDPTRTIAHDLVQVLPIHPSCLRTIAVPVFEVDTVLP